MSKLKISSDQFLGSAELNRFQQFLSKDGFVKGLLNNSVAFGLIKTNTKSAFLNAQVGADSNVVLNNTLFKAINIQPISGFDKNGNFLRHDNITSQLPIPSDNRWYWIRISHEFSHVEKGVWSLSANGVLTGTQGELTKIARGQANFPTRIRFKNAQHNVYEYDILTVEGDNLATLAGTSFVEETKLELEIVGTFTYNTPIAKASKGIYQYDSCLVELVPEVLGEQNVRPSEGFEVGRTFYIARVKSDGETLAIQDKRADIWTTTAAAALNTIETASNPLIGVEAIRYDHPFTTQNKNLVNIAWAFRSTSWSLNTATNTLTIGAGQGGKLQSIQEVDNNVFNGWRLYAPNGRYHVVVSTVKQGNAIDLVLDSLDVDNFSTDGGETFLSTQQVVVAPNAESIVVTFTPDRADDVSAHVQTFTFPINQAIGVCDVLCYKDMTLNGIEHVGGSYNISYRYQNHAIFSNTYVFPNNTKGYLNEKSFDDNGNISNAKYTTYAGSTTQSYIHLLLSPTAYSNFNNKIDKGDLIGIQRYTDVSTLSVINLLVGQTLNYIHFTNALNLTQNLQIVLDDKAVNGNEFRMHFDFGQIVTNDASINIMGNAVILKTLTRADWFAMRNQQHGLVITAKFDGSSWTLSQNYDLGVPHEMKMIYADPNTLFENGWGKVRGLYGYALATDGSIEGTPAMGGRAPVAYSPNNQTYGILGNKLGQAAITLSDDQLNHRHTVKVGASQWGEWNRSSGSARPVTSVGNIVINPSDAMQNGTTEYLTINAERAPIDVTQPSLVVVFAKKMY